MIDLIIPTYNAEDTIGRALASIAAQTKQRKFLVTVVDDCSTDATAAIVQKFKGIIPLQYIKLEKNLGKPGLVRNEGIKRTNCPYIMFLDADDMLMPMAGEVLSRAVTQKFPDIILGSFYVENRLEKEKDRYSIFSTNKITWLHGNVYSRKYLKENNIEFDNRMNEDGSFNMKAICLTDNIYHIEEPMAIWTHNPKSLTRSNNHFMLNISTDYIDTYTDAIEFIIEKDNEQVIKENFIDMCAHKLAEFFEFAEANNHYNKSMEEILNSINNYVNILKKYKMLSNSFIQKVNECYNNFEIFRDIIRTHTVCDYFNLYEIDYREAFNEWVLWYS